MAHPTDRHISCRIITLTVHFARSLPNVRHLFKNRIQAQITLGDDPRSKIKSHADKRHGLNPVWNFHCRYVIPVSKITVENLPVRIRLYSQRTLLSDGYVGEVNIFLGNMLDNAAISNSTDGEDAPRSVVPADFPLIGRASETNGVLNMSYSFGKPFLMDAGELQKWAHNNEGGGRPLLGLANNVADAIASGLEIANNALDLEIAASAIRFVGE